MTTQPDPEFRISTFGILVIKRLVLPRGLHPRYEVLSDEIEQVKPTLISMSQELA